MNDLFLEFEKLFGIDIFCIFSVLSFFCIVISLSTLLAKFVNELDKVTTSSREFFANNEGGCNYEKMS